MLRSTLRALVLVLALYPRRVAVQVLLAHGRRRILLRTESSVDRRTLPRAQLIGLYVGFGCSLSTPDSPSHNTAASQPASQDPARPSRSSKKRHLERLRTTSTSSWPLRWDSLCCSWCRGRLSLHWGRHGVRYVAGVVVLGRRGGYFEVAPCDARKVSCRPALARTIKSPPRGCTRKEQEKSN